MQNELGKAALAAVALNVTMLLLGWWLATLAKLPQTQRITIAIEVGLQNLGLAAVIIFSLLKDVSLMLPVLFYIPSMRITGVLLILYSRWPRAT